MKADLPSQLPFAGDENDPETKKEFKRLVPAWRYVTFVPNVRGFTNPSLKNEKLKQTKINDNLGLVEKSRTNGTNGTDKKNCGKCANFQIPSCQAKDWESRNGNAQPNNDIQLCNFESCHIQDSSFLIDFLT